MMGSLYKALATTSQRWIIVVALSSVTLATIPVASRHTVTHFAVLVPFVLSIGWALPRMRSKVNVIAASAVVLYGLSLAIEAFRGYPTLNHAVDDTVLVAVLLTFGITLMASAQSGEERTLRIAALALSPAIYVAVNVLMRIGHVGPSVAADPGERALAAGESASLLEHLGFTAQRIQFPLASGINTMGAVAAGGFAAAMLLAIFSDAFPRRLTIPLAAVSAYGALATDSRTSILISLVVIALTVAAPRLRTATAATLLLGLAPILLISLLGQVGGGVFSELTRNKTEQASTLNGRFFIWKGAWDVAGELNSHTLVGWGAFGQVTSGASRNYAYLFRATPDPTKYTAHNIVLQTILDGGYLSLVVFLIAVLLALRGLERAIRGERRGLRAPPRVSPLAALRASLLVVLFTGVTEALPDYTSYDCLALVLVAFGAAAAVLSPAGSKHPVKTRSRGLARAHVSAFNPRLAELDPGM